MLLLRCAACRRKLWRYDKVGKGALLRCHKSRIEKDYGNTGLDGSRVLCRCGKVLGFDKGGHIRMASKTFSASGTKRTGGVPPARRVV